MKVLAIVKRVEDPEIKITIKGDGSDIETDQMKYVVNPFDEIAVEEAIRLRDTHSGELAIACVGSKDATQQIRTALAMGADRGIHVVTEDRLDPMTEAKALTKIIEEEAPDVVIVGKQAVDDDMGQIGPMMAQNLGWAQVSFASKEESLEGPEEKAKKPALMIADGTLKAVREVDGGLETTEATLPAIVTTELRLNVPRYASLPGIMKAKKKPIAVKELAEVVGGATAVVKVLTMEAPAQRAAGVKVDDTAALMDKLRNEAKVI